MSPTWSSLTVGDQLLERLFPIQRADLIKYAGASLDFNLIHWNERVALEVGLPNVVAHGMLTMAKAVQVVTEWTGDPGCIIEYGCRFTRPVVVPDNSAGALLFVTGSVTALNDDGTVQVTLTATCDGATVLGKAQVLVRLPRQ
jgi:acyl dehydratase